MRRSINSSDLDNRLKKLVQKKNQIEKDYRDTNQRFWTIMFIDVSSSAKDVWAMGEEVANDIFASYQQLVRLILDQHNACFIEPGGGPQIVCCFEDPEACLQSAQTVLHVLKETILSSIDDTRLTPSMGIHQGYINFHDGTIHQSNTNNKTKRIQTEAAPGQIYSSKEIQEVLQNNPQFCFQHKGKFTLKNIPEPQDIYEVLFRTLAEMDAFAVTETRTERPVSPVKAAVCQESHQWIFVYIDVCESTKKFWKFGDREASSLINDYQKLCHTTFQQCGCVYAKSCEGDQIIGAFELSDANSAAVSSIKILKDLFRRNVHVGETKQIRAAIGIHTGEVVLEGGEPVTTGDMRVGKAIQSQAGADEILISKDVTQMLDAQIQRSISSYGICEFSGIPEPYDVFSLNWTHIQLRPSLLHPSRPKRSSRSV